MPLELVIPRLSEKERNTKDLIVEILCREWPLTAKSIYGKVKNCGIDVTYQAVHKTIRNLAEQEVVTKTPKGYQLNEEWIKSMHDFSEKLKKSYAEHEIAEFSKFPQTLTFETQIDMGKFLLDLFERDVLGDFKKICANWSFIWTPLPFSKKEYNQLKSISKRKDIYIITKDNRFYSKFHSVIWRKIGAEVKINVKDVPEMDYFVYGPYVIQIFWGKKIRNSQEFTSRYFKRPKDIDVHELYEAVLRMKGEISVVILKDEKLAERLGKEVLKHFRK